MRLFIILFLLFLTFLIEADDFKASELEILPEDLILEEDPTGGYHLWIRKKPGISSVLLTESTADPEKQLDSFALRDPEYNSINGDEKRILRGKFLEKNRGILDSTPETHDILQEAFHLYIPYVVEYGYPWSRQGEVLLTVGSFINIKAFSRPYADWEGASRDNPFTISLLPQIEQKVLPDGNYNPQTIENFSRIAGENGGKSIITPGKEDLVLKIGDLIDDEEGDSLDLVLALDTTMSMQDELPFLKRELVPLISKHTDRFKHLRVGLLFYRDYYEQYLVKNFPFAEDLAVVQANIDRAKTHGGKEIPEAVFEALWSGIESYPWEADSRLLILIGDAPPHPRPRGAVTEEMVYSKAAEDRVTINTIILPQ